MKNKPICIIGGMGPQASAYLYTLLIQKAISDFGAKKDDQFPEIIIYSVSVPDFISEKKNAIKTLKMLKKTIAQINKLDISSISIACNTAHLLLPQLEKSSKIPFTSMINEVALTVKDACLKRVGLLGTPTTIQSGLYQNVLRKFDIEVVVPAEKQFLKIEKVIRNVISGKNTSEDVKVLLKSADNLIRKGAEGIILGCTELPLIFPKRYDVPIYSSLDILADSLLIGYYNGRQKSR